MSIVGRFWRWLCQPQSVEEWTRFAVDKAYYRPGDRTVRHNAFMPDKEQVVSVFDLRGASVEGKIQHGTEHVAKPRGKEIRAVIGLPHRAVVHADLETQIDEPPPKHHVLIGWPTEKERIKDRALALAAAAYVLTIIPG